MFGPLSHSVAGTGAAGTGVIWDAGFLGFRASRCRVSGFRFPGLGLLKVLAGGC